jgi:hypothetical protein
MAVLTTVGCTPLILMALILCTASRDFRRRSGYRMLMIAVLDETLAMLAGLLGAGMILTGVLTL